MSNEKPKTDTRYSKGFGETTRNNHIAKTMDMLNDRTLTKMVISLINEDQCTHRSCLLRNAQQVVVLYRHPHCIRVSQNHQLSRGGNTSEELIVVKLQVRIVANGTDFCSVHSTVKRI